ncbi:hypothetical protein K488DRAFT_83530 [Vararia minispora EC-137]|uniref:Uncharacterized protein n=1 Tax=Vararia minispora EC-137 TaxID=1314806 RepID=A0ACB8QTU1_9AGAM|nr:hypothetical protein K488DRAFT_83530 [Vararia minispora EC-137]
MHAAHRADTIKSSYDDLADEYATPYHPTSRHKSYTFDTGSRQSLSTAETADIKVRPVDFDPPPPPGYPPTSSTVLPLKGKWWKTVMPDSLSCKIYILVVLIETAIDLTIEGDLLIRIHDATESTEANAQTPTLARKMPVYLAIFCLAHIWQFVLAIDAVYARNTLQFIALALFNAAFLAYAIIQSSEIHATLSGVTDSNGFSHIPVNILLNISPVVIGISELVYVGLGYKIYTEFGWKVYKFLGADRQIKRMFAHYQIFQCLVKFDLFFWISFCVQFVGLILPKSDWEYYLTIIALPLSIVLVIEGYLAARYENKWMMVSFLTGCSGGLVYFTYKFVKVQIQSKQPQFQDVYQSLTTFSLISIILLIVTIAYAVIVWRNFGRGLKAQISKAGVVGASKHGAYPSLSVRPSRMSFE